jgi:hypothetical protein
MIFLINIFLIDLCLVKEMREINKGKILNFEWRSLIINIIYK